KQDVNSKAVFERPAPISVTGRRNGRRLYCAQSATTFTNLILPRRGFVNGRATVVASMVNVKIASLLFVQHPLPHEAARRHGWRLWLFDLIQDVDPRSASGSRFTARAFEVLTFTQSGERPERSGSQVVSTRCPH